MNMEHIKIAVATALFMAMFAFSHFDPDMELFLPKFETDPERD